jgi:hypothetical protein
LLEQGEIIRLTGKSYRQPHDQTERSLANEVS